MCNGLASGRNERPPALEADRGEEFVSVRLTAEAYAHGLALALPEEVAVPVISGGRDLTP